MRGWMFNINTEYWKVCPNVVQPGGDKRVMEIRTKETGETVIPWSAFDNRWSSANNLALARRIVRMHNEDLNRQKNKEGLTR